MPDSLETTIAEIGRVQVVIAFKKGALATGNDLTSAKADLEGYFMKPGGAQLEGLAAAETERRSGVAAASSVATEADQLRVYPKLGLAIGYADAAGLENARKNPRIADVVEAPQISLIRPVASRSGRLTVRPSWGIRRLRVDELWAAGFDGHGVVVGHLDTGIDGTHPALRGAIDEFAEFDLNGHRIPGVEPWDSGDHGTHTAGTIVGRPSNNAFGVAPGAKVASGMVIEGGQVVNRVLAGMEWVAEKGVRILSMSLGLRGFTPAFEVIIDALRELQILPIIAVGNESPNTSRSPGNYPTVLSVGACDRNDVVAGFSSSQLFDRKRDPLVPDLVAPGVGILSCAPGGGLRSKNGTSMATPHVAGLAALLLQARPASTIAELEAAIIDSCTRPASMLELRGNRGIPDAVQAFTILMGNPPASIAA